MKNLRKYSREKYEEVIYDYKHSFVSNKRLSEIHNIPLGTIDKWTACVKRNFNKPCFITGKIIESLVYGNELSEYFSVAEHDVEYLMDKYFGKNENNFAGLKSKM